MSQGLTWIAARRMPLVALVALTALAVALFAVISIASAAPALVVSIDDSDNIVDAGASNTVSFAVTGDDGGDPASTYTVDFIVVGNGIVFSRDAAGGEEMYATRSADQVTAETAAADATPLGTIIYPPNAAGEYTISVRATNADDDTLDGTLTITVGDAGDAIGAVSVSLGKVGHSTAKNAKTDSDTTTAGTVPATFDLCNDVNGSDEGMVSNPGCIAVTVSVLNSLGEPANSNDITGIHLFAPLATIYSADTVTAAGGGGTININETVDDQGAVTSDTVGASEKFYVAKGTAGVVNVSAIILGKGNSTSEILTLTFTGTADAIALGDPSSPLSPDGTKFVQEVEGVDADGNDVFTDPDDTAPVTGVDAVGVANIEVNATDKSGNPAPLTPGETVVVEVTDANGDVVETITDNQRSKPNTLTLIVEMIGTAAEPGSYTVTMTLGDDLDEQTAEIVVAGKVANVDLEVSQTAVAVGDIITVTATVTDEDGNLQPDAGKVSFQAVGALVLAGLGADATNGNTKGALDDGVATGRFVVVSGSGTATIIASLGGVDGVTSVSTEADVEEVVDEPAPEPVDGLSQTELNNFASWSGDGTVSASELLAGIPDATGLLYYDGDSWQHYGVTDGQVIPGSRDFTVRSGYVIWISG